jgi:hypothetical protein
MQAQSSAPGQILLWLFIRWDFSVIPKRGNSSSNTHSDARPIETRHPSAVAPLFYPLRRHPTECSGRLLKAAQDGVKNAR